MPIVPAPLQKTVDTVFRKIRRSTPYVERYNNTLGFFLNERYLRYARECRIAYAARNGKQDFKKSDIHTKSVQCVKNILPADKAKRYSDRFTELIASENIVDAGGGTANLLRKISEPIKNLDHDFLNIFHTPQLHQALLAFFHSDYRIQWLSAFRTLPSADIAPTWKWHSDSFPPNTCKLFLHLTPVTAESGATNFLTPEDTKAYRRAGYIGQSREERLADFTDFAKEHNLPHRPYNVDVEAGDGSIFNMNYFHRAVAPKHDYRDVIEFFLFPNPIPWDEQIAKDGVESLECHGDFPKDPRRS